MTRLTLKGQDPKSPFNIGLVKLSRKRNRVSKIGNAGLTVVLIQHIYQNQEVGLTNKNMDDPTYFCLS